MSVKTVLCLGAILWVLSGISARLGAKEPQTHSATTPMSRQVDNWWKARHEGFNKRAVAGDVDLLFIGDSITQGWESDGKEAWQKYYGDRKAMNIGISGDRTQHVLWRLDHGNVEGISPKLAILMIGTNNSNGKDNTAGEIADGIKAIVARLREKLPMTKVLILAVFPRGEKPNPQREKIAELNHIVSQLADDKTVFYLDIGKNFLTEDGTLAKDIMPDFLHLSPKAYDLWAKAIEPKVAEVLGDKPRVP